MKIAILVHLFPPKWLAGTEIATYNIAKYLTKSGHEVHVITSLDEGLPKESVEERFYVHRIKLHFKIPFLSIFLYFITLTPHLFGEHI
jgi:glycosyltransferase involved in cell wall biosynthesis